MSKQKEQQPDVNRRRILRGLATAPVVMTLGNAHAQAIASNMACIGNNALDLQAKVEADPYITQAAASPSWCAPIDSLPADALTPTIKPAGFYTHPSGGSNALMTPVGAPANNACVVYVDQSGTMQSLIPTDGSPITASCYTSFV